MQQRVSKHQLSSQHGTKVTTDLQKSHDTTLLHYGAWPVHKLTAV